MAHLAGSELKRARDRALGDIEKLGSALKSTGAAHRSVTTAPDPFAGAPPAAAARRKRAAAPAESPPVSAS